MKATKNGNKQSGAALLLTILMVSVLLAIVFTISGIFLPKLRSSAQSKKSVTAMYAAESGAEWCMFERNVGPTDKPLMGNNSDYYNKEGHPLDESDCKDMPLKVIGEYKGVTRAFELSL